MTRQKLNRSRNPQIAFRVSPDTVKRFSRLVHLTSRPGTFYNTEALLMLIDEMDSGRLGKAKLQSLTISLTPRGGAKKQISFPVAPELMERMDVHTVATGLSRAALNTVALLMNLPELEKIYLGEQQIVKEALVQRVVGKQADPPTSVRAKKTTARKAVR
jgi:predicted DNA-binding protein